MSSHGSDRSVSARAALVARAGLVLAGVVASGSLAAQDCPLTSPLVLKDTQDGFAGQTGTVWTIAPDCSFTVAHQTGPKVTEPFREGQLSPQEQARLKQLLARAALSELPEQLGSGPPVNARHITLSYGGKVSVLTMPPGGGDLSALQAAAGEGPAGRLLGLADSVSAMTGG